ncbi:MAG: hypothetical protein HZB53_05565 [Chloroflexi bacterium]|nr:hypothetical protein [Chloroflexota bacterium]
MSQTQGRYKSQYADRAVRNKAQEVKQYHKDDSLPGKPLYLLIPGGLFALASLALIVYVCYAWLLDGSMADTQATNFLCLLAPVYIGSVFLFSYGYELYDVPKALRLTAVIVFLTVAAVVIVAVLFALLGDSKGGSSSKGSSSSSGSSSKGGGSVLDGIGSFVSGGSSSSGGSSYSGGSMPIFMNIGGPAQTVTHEVIREVPVPTEPPPPQPVTCPFCGRSYIPAETKFACPNCGAATPQELLAPDDQGPAPDHPGPAA